jgi:ribosomal protein S27AE
MGPTYDPLSVLMFQSGERVLFTIVCQSRDPSLPAATPGFLDPLIRDVKAEVYTFPGILVVTNHRMVFLEQRPVPRGRPDDYRVRDAIDLESVRGLTLGHIAKDEPVLLVSYDHGGRLRERGYFGPGLDAANLDHARASLQAVAAARARQLEEQRRRDRVQVVVDFSFLRGALERGGLAVTAVKCPNCSASVSLPETGDLLKCAYCGSTIHAADLFEKLKGLIGGQ